MAVNCTADPNNIECTLSDVGDGLGNMFDALGNPLGNFLIIIGIAAGIGAMFLAIVSRVRQA
jgi:hypothetical protein